MTDNVSSVKVNPGGRVDSVKANEAVAAMAVEVSTEGKVTSTTARTVEVTAVTTTTTTVTNPRSAEEPGFHHRENGNHRTTTLDGETNSPYCRPGWQ